MTSHQIFSSHHEYRRRWAAQYLQKDISTSSEENTVHVGLTPSLA
jgi:hypothetical protein